MSHFKCRLNRRFWRWKKSGTSCPNWGEVIWTKSKRTETFFRETFPYIIKESNSPETHISLELNITSLGPNRHKQNYISPIVWPKIPLCTYNLSRHPCLQSSNLFQNAYSDRIDIYCKWNKLYTFDIWLWGPSACCVASLYASTGWHCSQMFIHISYSPMVCQCPTLIAEVH